MATNKQRLYVDMDGTLAVFTPVDELETLYEKGYFENLVPHENVVEAVKIIISEHPDIEVNILSAYLTDSQYALAEKNAWLDRHLPEIDEAHRVFLPCGSNKREYIDGGVRPDDFLLDDYTQNLNDWQPPARGIKLLNDINHTRGSWEFDRLRFDKTPSEFASNIVEIMREGIFIKDERPIRRNEIMDTDEMVKDIAMLDFVNGVNRNALQSGQFRNAFMSDSNLPAGDTIGAYLTQWDVANTTDSFSPRLAVLQLAAGEENRLRRFTSLDDLLKLEGETPNADNYEVVFIEKQNNALAESNLGQVYSRFNDGSMHPANYYGHSLSVGDVVVLAEDSMSMKAYFVDSVGFTELPEFLNDKIKARISTYLDIRKEHDMIGNIHAAGLEENKNILTDANNDRYSAINLNYLRIFELADRRAEMLKEITLEALESLNVGDVAFLYNLSNGVNILEAQDLNPEADNLIGYDTSTGEEVKFQYKDIEGIRRNGIEHHREEIVEEVKSDRQPFVPSKKQADVLNALYSSIVTRMKYPNDEVLQADITEKLKGFAQELDALHVPFAVQNAVAGAGEIRSNWDRYNNEVLQEVFQKGYRPQTFVDRNSEGIEIAGHKGKWHTIDSTKIDGQEYFLMEHDTYGDEAACLIVNTTGSLILDDVYNGFDDLRDYFENREDFDMAIDDVTGKNDLPKETVPSSAQSNFNIEKLESGTYVVRSDSERFGKQAITFESHSRSECVDYIANNSEQEKPSYYIIEDLSTWANNLPADERSKFEPFDNLDDAISKFMEYRVNDYDYSDGKSKLAMGASIGSGSYDILHVRDGVNVFVRDFIGTASFDTNKEFLSNMAKINGVVGFDVVRIYRDENGARLKEPRNVNFAEWDNPFFQSGNRDKSAVEVAIESTDDFADTTFHAELADADIQNEDGSYGKVKDYYRLVSINDEGFFIPYPDNKTVFFTSQEAKMYISQNNLTEVNYDTFVYQADAIQREIKAEARQNLAHGEQMNANEQAVPVNGGGETPTEYARRLSSGTMLTIAQQAGVKIGNTYEEIDRVQAFVVDYLAVNPTLGNDDFSMKVLDACREYQRTRDAEINSSTIEPIQEFRDNNGRLLEGSQIALYEAEQAGTNFVNRQSVYGAVKAFQDANNIPDNMRVIDENGSYEDKDFLYSAYDNFLAMSHAQELEGYRERFSEAIAANAERMEGYGYTVNNEAFLLPLLAEVYYAKANNLTEGQIDLIIGDGHRNWFNMRAVRIGFEAGLSAEQVALFADMKDSFSQEYMAEFLASGGTVEQARVFFNTTDMQTVRAVIDGYKEGLSVDCAAVIVSADKGLRMWNQYVFDMFRAENPKTEYIFRSMDFDFMTEYLVELAKNGSSPEDIKALADAFSENVSRNPQDTERRNLREFNENDFSKRNKEGSNENMAHSNTSEVSGIEQGGEAVSAKDKLKETLTTGVQSMMESDNFKNWLKTGGKMFYNNYSFNNAMLVWLQKPDASYVMGYEAWKEFGRNVAQGAQGAKIFMPVMASETAKGGLFRMIKNNLSAQLSKDTSLQQAVYRLGQSNLEFTMNRAGLIGRRINGAEKGIFDNDEVCKQYIDRSILGKTPMYFNVGTVFDAKDVLIPEFLWVKKGYTKEELVKDENDKPIKTKRGEYKIYNTPERQARFNPDLNTYIVAQDPAKMKILLDVCIAASERKGIHVYMRDTDTDDTLKSGAKGYFSRRTSDENPNGFIVLDKTLEPTELCAVMFHEMGHADMHKNLDALAQKLGEERVTKSMREIQAEAVAYMTASTFGIETDTSSFAYLAVYTQGFELQEFQRSIEVIYAECQQLIGDIKAELDVRNLNLDLTEREAQPLDKETIEHLSKGYIAFSLEREDAIHTALEELPSLVSQNKGNSEIIDVLKEQKKNIDRQKEDIEAIKTGVGELSKLTSKTEQEACIDAIGAAKTRISGNMAAFEVLTERYIHLNEQARGGLKVDFDKNPLDTLEQMKKTYPKLAELSDAQTKYVSMSKFISREYGKLLRSDPQEFVDLVCERAERISTVAAKNGTFVEVVYCEQWGETPIVQGGTMCHPKVANDIMKQGELQVMKLKDHAAKQGEYYPYTKCSITVFTPTVSAMGLSSITSRLDLGTGEQKDLVDHMATVCKRGKEKSEIYSNLETASKERGAKDKILVPTDFAADATKSSDKDVTNTANKSHSDWGNAIDAEKQGNADRGNEGQGKSRNNKAKDEKEL